MVIAFYFGLIIGVFLPSFLSGKAVGITHEEQQVYNLNRIFITNDSVPQDKSPFDPVTFVEEDGIVEDGIFWGRNVEEIIPSGFSKKECDFWIKYVSKAKAVRLESGCGRMQNRLVVFQDGTMGCVRYRQNLDQIQGELFSFHLAQLLQIQNLAPSTISLVDLQTDIWKNLPAEIAAAQWNANRPVVITKFIPDLNNANIPKGFRPPERRLNKNYILGLNVSSVAEKSSELVELSQWSDLIIFDYLTANLDRVVNNLYNRQWNINIMDAPAHNLAKKSDSLLVFLDNESGLLHGYRLLSKYEPYHSLLLDNLCMFRKRTIKIIERLRREKNVGKLLVQMFETKTAGFSKVRDFLPFLPEKSVKILSERINRVYEQVNKCRRQVSTGL